MNKSEFMNALAYAVRDLPGAQQERLLWDYEARFVQAIYLGEAEADIAKRLTHPHLIARHARLQHKLSQLQGKISPADFLRYSLRLLTLFWLNVLMLGPMLVYLLLLFCGSVVAFIVNCAGVAVIYFALNGTSQVLLSMPSGSTVTYSAPGLSDKVPQLDWRRNGLSWKDDSGVRSQRAGLLLLIPHFNKSDVWYGLQLSMLGLVLSLLSWYWGRFSWRGAKRYGRWQWRQLQYHSAAAST